jgi:flagellar biosynthetic protein FlhB
MSSDKHSKTEKPTPKRKKDARRDGQIARSPDLLAWTSILVASVLGRMVIKNSIDLSQRLFQHAGTAITQADTGVAMKLLQEGLVGAFTVVAPLVFGLMAVGIAGNIGQVGWAVSGKAIKPKFKKINPFTGLKRLFSPNSAWEGGKSFLKLAMLALLAWNTMRGVTPQLTDHGHMETLGSLVGVVADRVSTFIRNAAALGLVIAAADYFYQHRKIAKSLMMSKQDLKDEARQSDGDPHVKAQIKAAMRRMSRLRMMAEVATADAVIVNPTHVAVAIKYDAAKGAPRIVAKGADTSATRIREEAAKHAVPMVEDIPLARTLYRMCDIGDEIPGQLYEAVARLLAFIYSLKARGRATPVGGGAHRPPQGFLPPELATLTKADAREARRRVA